MTIKPHVTNTLIETICSEMWANPLPKNAKSTLPVDVSRSKTSLL